MCASGNRTSVRGPCTAWRLAAWCAPPGGDYKTVGLRERWYLAVRRSRQRSGLVSLGGAGAKPGGNPANYASCTCCVLSNDVIL